MSSHSGWLWVNDEWLEVALQLDDDSVSLETPEAQLGSWPRSEVDFGEGVDGLYPMQIEGESLPFKPHAPLPFAAAVIQSSRPATIGPGYMIAARRWWKAQSLRRKAVIIAGTLLLANGVAGAGNSDSPAVESAAIDLSASSPTTSTTAPPAKTVETDPTPSTTSNSPQPVTVMVLAVTDGDTIRVQMPDGTSKPVRLIGIDAPEDGQSFSIEAKNLLERLVLGKKVELVSDVSDRDKYDRLLRYVFVDDLNVNEALVLAGLAIAVEYPPDTAMADLLAAAELEAKTLQVGGWATTTTTTITTIATTQPAADCHPSYQGACVPNNVSDVDCAGGSGNGPYYVKGPVYVVGPDVYDLDRDGDGVGCE